MDVNGTGRFSNLLVTGENWQESPSIPKVLSVADPSDLTKTISLGYDDNLDAGIIASVHKSTGWKKILIQPYGGNVGIGTTDPKNKLSVNGTIWAKEVKVSLTDGADWVFEDDYELMPLTEVAEFIKSNKHLPDVPSADEFRENDLNVAEMDNKLLQKIEELTLYLIEQNKQNQTQQALIEQLQKEVSALKNE